MVNKKKRDASKKEFWDKFTEDLRAINVLDFVRYSSFCYGYLYGLLKTGIITEKEKSEMEMRLDTAILYENRMKEERIKRNKEE